MWPSVSLSWRHSLSQSVLPGKEKKKREQTHRGKSLIRPLRGSVSDKEAFLVRRSLPSDTEIFA